MLFTEHYKKIPSDIYGDSFVGMNTGHGFVGIYDSLIDETALKRLFIIKGAAGTGKSTFMKKLAKRAAESGIPTERFACSSDPDSLDCVILNSSAAVLDGTMPHPCEMKYPGSSSEIIDVSRFWNNDALIKERSYIENFSKKKSEAFEKAYHSLKYLEILSKERVSSVSKTVNIPKMTAVIERFVKGLGKPPLIGRSAMKIHRGIGMKGKFRLDTLEKQAETVIQIADVYGSAYIFMKHLARALENSGHRHLISPDPITPELICDIYMTDSRILITVEDLESPDRVINMQRFVQSEQLSEHRGTLRLSEKCTTVITDDVLNHLKNAGNFHFELERIYSSAMDFESLSDFTDSKTYEIISRFC